jgi:hypothetical protein
MTIIRNKFRTKCASTLRVILPGELILLDGKKAYSIHSKEYIEYKQRQDDETRSTRAYIEAQELAQFERNVYRGYFKPF